MKHALGWLLLACTLWVAAAWVVNTYEDCGWRRAGTVALVGIAVVAAVFGWLCLVMWLVAGP
jgi:hypothetical protein